MGGVHGRLLLEPPELVDRARSVVPAARLDAAQLPAASADDASELAELGWRNHREAGADDDAGEWNALSAADAVRSAGATAARDADASSAYSDAATRDADASTAHSDAASDSAACTGFFRHYAVIVNCEYAIDTESNRS